MHQSGKIIWVIIGSGNGLVSDGIKPLPEFYSSYFPFSWTLSFGQDFFLKPIIYITLVLVMQCQILINSALLQIK